MTATFVLDVRGGPAELSPTDRALVRVTPELLATIQARRARFVRDHDEDDQLYEVYYFDGAGVAFLANEQEDLDAGEALCMGEELDEALNALAGDAAESEEAVTVVQVLDEHLARRLTTIAEARVECVQMIIGELGVCWMCYPKHVDTELRTAWLTWATIEAVAGEETDR